MEKIIITGSPGTGKSTIASLIGEEENKKVVHVDSEFVIENNLSLGKEDGSEAVDLRNLKRLLEDTKGIIESHLLCEFNLPSSLVIVLRCRPKVLKKRLNHRGYSMGKIKENLEAEAMGYCTQRAEDNYREVYEVETSDRKAGDTVEKCIEVIHGGSKGDKGIDYSDYLLCSL